MSRKFKNDKDSFCYACGEFVFKENRETIDEFYKKAYYTCFKIKLGHQDKIWTIHIVCKTCKESLRIWMTSKKNSSKIRNSPDLA